MSAETCCLALHLQAPLQSWGMESQFNRRTTASMPGKSAVAGMICAALGLDRGSEGEAEMLAALAKISMLAVAVPRPAVKNTTRVLPLGRTIDFHTVQGTRRATGGLKACHITRRHYLHDGNFYVFLSGAQSVLHKMGVALQNPVWGLWLGRKSCIPSAPVFAGIFDDEVVALTQTLGAALETFTYEREVARFDDGTDSLMDQVGSFSSSQRCFAPRRVMRHQKQL